MHVLRTLYARRYKQRWYGCLPLFSSTRLLKSRFSLHFYWYNHLFLLVLLLFLSSSTVSVSGLFRSLCVWPVLYSSMDAEINRACAWVCVCALFPTPQCFRHDPRPFLFVLLFYQITHMTHLIAGTQIMNAYRAMSLFMRSNSNFNSSLLILIFDGQVGGGVEANQFSQNFVVQVNQILQFNLPHLKWKTH